MLYESWVLFEILEWVDNSVPGSAAPSTGLTAPVGVVGSGPAAITWGPESSDEAHEASVNLLAALRKAITAHCVENGLDSAKKWEGEPWREYQRISRDKARVQQDRIARPVTFPNTLCRLEPDEDGYMVWNTAIWSYFQDVANAGLATGEMTAAVADTIRNKASEYYCEY
jgi:hypothetical protein